LGRAQRFSAIWGEAERSFHQAAAAALQGADPATAADAWTNLVVLSGFFRHQTVEAQRWSGYARAAIHRIGDDDERLGDLFIALGLVNSHTDDLDQAEKHAKEARAHFVRGRGEKWQRLWEVDSLLAMIAAEKGDFERSREIYDRLRERYERLFGATHFLTQNARGNEADCLTPLGRPAEAVRLLGEILRTPDDSIQDHAWWRHRMADALRGLRRYREALAQDQRSARAYERVLGASTGQLVLPLLGWAQDLLGLGRPAEAIPLLERMLALCAWDPRGTTLTAAEARFELARALVRSGGSRERALGLARQAREGFRPRAERYGSVFARHIAEIEAWMRRRGDQSFR
jgi:tetratricopeptide (TPR) repeat protein